MLSRRSRALVRAPRELCGACAGALLEQLRGVPDAVGSVLVIGHNPGLQRLALARPAPAVEELEANYPTAGLAALVFDGPSWRELDRGSAELVGFVRPRDLAP
jgi:phosphohistidine phosphatase